MYKRQRLEHCLRRGLLQEEEVVVPDSEVGHLSRYNGMGTGDDAVSYTHLISVLDKLGIPTTSIITSLGAVGLAISLAVKDSIATLAGGVVILVLKPFNLGDYVEIDGLGGTVREITMFNTVLNTPDNKRISLPNDSVYKAKVVNYSAEPNRRLDLVFTIGYNDDYDKAKALIEKVIQDCPLALDDPAPVVRMSGHGASAIEITTRVWVKNSDYFELQFRMYEDVKKIFDQNGISIPFNQLDVHITQN